MIFDNFHEFTLIATALVFPHSVVFIWPSKTSPKVPFPIFFTSNKSDSSNLFSLWICSIRCRMFLKVYNRVSIRCTINPADMLVGNTRVFEDFSMNRSYWDSFYRTNEWLATTSTFPVWLKSVGFRVCQSELLYSRSNAIVRNHRAEPNWSKLTYSELTQILRTRFGFVRWLVKFALYFRKSVS